MSTDNKVHKEMKAHYIKNDKGFTLIEMLVAILIIALLSGVALIALLSSVNSGRKTSTTTVLRTAIGSVQSWQNSIGQADYTGLTIAIMNSEDPDITWVGAGTQPTAGASSISFRLSAGVVYLAARSERNICYFAALVPYPTGGQESVRYASTSGVSCTATIGSTAPVLSTYVGTTTEGWNR